MHIYQPFITCLCRNLASTAEDPQHDFEIATVIAAQAQTILFAADQALALRPHQRGLGMSCTCRRCARWGEGSDLGGRG